MKVSKVDEQVFGQRHFCLQHKEGMKEISDGWHVTFEKFIYLRLVRYISSDDSNVRNFYVVYLHFIDQRNTICQRLQIIYLLLKQAIFYCML